MKRGLVLSLAALALVVGNSAAQAQNVQISLNLRYTDPANPAEGGSWYLMGKTDHGFGLAGVSAYLNNVDLASIKLGNSGSTVNAQYATLAANATGSMLNGSDPFKGTFGSVVNVVWGFDGTAIVPNVGKAGGAGVIATDPLKNAAWNNASLLVSGTFGAVRPTFATNVGPNMNNTDANVLFNNTLPWTVANDPIDAATTTTVRGDSLATLGLNTPPTAGLQRGDRDRSFGVNLNTDIFPALAFIGTGPGKTWDQGDFNNDGQVNLNTDIFPSLANIGVAPVPPAISAVPEPATFGLLGAAMGMSALAVRRRR